MVKSVNNQDTRPHYTVCVDLFLTIVSKEVLGWVSDPHL